MAWSEDAFAPEGVEAAVHEEWAAHAQVYAVVAGVSDAAAQSRAAAARLDAAVAQARQAGASWETIGRGAGITRQAAHERWAT